MIRYLRIALACLGVVSLRCLLAILGTLTLAGWDEIGREICATLEVAYFNGKRLVCTIYYTFKQVKENRTWTQMPDRQQ